MTGRTATPFAACRPRTLRERRLHFTSYRRIRLLFCAEDCGSRNGRLFNKRFGTYKFLPLYALRPQRGLPNAPRRTEPVEVTVVSAAVSPARFRVTSPGILRTTSVNGQK